MNVAKIKNDLDEIMIYLNAPLSRYTFTKTGGPADALIFPETRHEVLTVVKYCKENHLPLLVLGNASNLIVRDGGIRGVVMMLTQMDNIQIVGEQVIVEAGAKLIDTSKVALDHHLTGLEFACGIPGSIGGAVYMNAGAYGGEIKDVLSKVDVLTLDGQIKTLTNHEMTFSYRHSILQQTNDIVLQTTFDLSTGDVTRIKSKMTELTELRTEKQPLEYPSCGSVFKRPHGHFTGKLIQDAGLQGLKWGGAQISEKHAGFIVNIDQATATDYIELISHIQQVIKEKFDVELETEVKIIGEA